MIDVGLLFAYQACKWLFGGVAERLRDDFNQSAADRIEDMIGRALKGDRAPVAPSPPSGGQVATVTDKEISEVFEQHPQQAGKLRTALEGKLGVKFAGPQVAVEGDAWFVAAYEAVLWRMACTACWEGRPIAVAGALQGQDWVTVCVPHKHMNPGKVLDPASMWRTSDRGQRLRKGPSPDVDFYMRRVEHGQAKTEAARLNGEFINTDEFNPGPPGPGKDAWHRVDGLNRGWVLLQWNDALRKKIEELRPRPPGFAVVLEADPPKWNECPQEWQLLMKIPDPAAGIRALSDGLDEYMANSAAAREAARAALDRGGQN